MRRGVVRFVAAIAPVGRGGAGRAAPSDTKPITAVRETRPAGGLAPQKELRAQRKTETTPRCENRFLP